MIYKVRVILDTKEDIFRDVEIKAKQTLWNLHLGIKSAFSLQEEELSTFHILEADGTIIKSVPLEDMSDEGDGEIMSDIYLDEAFQKVGDKVQFQYGLLDLWEFFCELVEISEEKPAVNYPITTYRFGKVPLKAPGKNNGNSLKNALPLMDIDFNDDFSEFDSNENYEDDDHNSFSDDQDNFDNDYYDDQPEDNE